MMFWNVFKVSSKFTQKILSKSLKSHLVLNSLILGMIDVTSHDGNNLWDVEGQVPDDSKSNNVTKEDDGDVNLFQFVRFLFMTMLFQDLLNKL